MENIFIFHFYYYFILVINNITLKRCIKWTHSPLGRRFYSKQFTSRRQRPSIIKHIPLDFLLYISKLGLYFNLSKDFEVVLLVCVLPTALNIQYG